MRAKSRNSQVNLPENLPRPLECLVSIAFLELRRPDSAIRGGRGLVPRFDRILIARMRECPLAVCQA